MKARIAYAALEINPGKLMKLEELHVGKYFPGSGRGVNPNRGPKQQVVHDDPLFRRSRNSSLRIAFTYDGLSQD